MAEYTALIMAGGRIGGSDALAAGTRIKALAMLDGTPLLVRVLDQIRQVKEVSRIVVVGSEEVSPWVGQGVEFCAETTTLLSNVQAGVKYAELKGEDRVLLVGSDLAFPKAGSFSDFIQRSPSFSKVTVPLVSRASYDQSYPNSGSRFVRLREGEFTIGSQFTSPAGLLLDPPPGVKAILGNRKSQLQMAATFGPGFVVGLMARSLTLAALENRAAQILTVSASAVPDCSPDLAFDIDNQFDLEYARSLVGGRKS